MPSLAFRSRTRSETRRLRWLAVVVGVVWLGALIGQMGLRPDYRELSALYAFGLPAVMYCSGMLLLGLAVSRGRSGAGPRPRWVRLSVLILPLLFVLSTLWIEVGDHSMIPQSAKAAWSAHLACGAMTLMLGAIPFALALLALRYAFPVHAAARGALVGLCCGLAATATIHLHCPVTVTSHILLSHGGPLLALTLLGGLLGRRILRT
jgi:hypothetical protein